jgi:hypothetical protein
MRGTAEQAFIALNNLRNLRICYARMLVAKKIAAVLDRRGVFSRPTLAGS